MTKWEIKKTGTLKNLKNTILIEGLPGIGNVGKIAADFIVEEIKAKKVYDLFSNSFPHSVFVNEDNLIDLPTISIYHKKIKDKDILFLVGDIQPSEEETCYEFCDNILDIASETKCKEIVTLGGIGLHSEPKKPKVYATGYNKKTVKDFIKSTEIHEKLFGVVGPIIGVSGLLVGLAQKKKIDAVALLAETSANPIHIGIKGSKELIEILNKQYSLGIDLKELKREIELIEKDALMRSEQMEEVTKSSALKKLQKKAGEPVDYIG
jgi:uncharacterized protein (TIGR00162 family)|tara:strand:- start:514 stop:1308 length:795 start_codon:yes stop_codon:yes gene_type:complete